MKVGFIGLGIMGKPMAKNLVKAGHELVVYDHKQASIDELVSCGAKAASSGKEVASQVEVVITMVQNSPQVRTAVLGENGVAVGAMPGLTLIDMSSIDPTESQEIAEACAKFGIDMLDAPVSGGEPKAIDGTLSVMVGGRKETFDKFYDLLSVMASSVVYVGGIGSGNVAKLANQMVVAINIAAVSEALIFAKKAGTDPELVYQAIRGGLAGSAVMDAKAPMMLEGNFKPGFRIELHIKDLNNALNAAHAVNSPAPLTAELMEVMQNLKSKGYEKEDHSAIVKFYEALAGTTVEK
jgi:2-hydroxy-3-oxopropionate reductase